MESTLPQPRLRTVSILLVEDNPDDVQLCMRQLRGAGFDPQWEVVQTTHELCARLTDKPFDVILADYTLPTCTGMEVLELLQQMGHEIPFILVTGTLDDDAAAQCLRKGATDYVHKDRLGRLPWAIRRALDMRFLRVERQRAELKLAQLEKSHQRLIELASEPVFIQSEDQLVFVNSPGVKLLGAESADDLLGQPMAAFFPTDRQPSLQRMMEQLGLDLEVNTLPEQFLRPDGKRIEVRLAATAITYNGKPAVQFVARDISERKRVEETIRHLAAFPQHNPNPVLEFSPEGKLTYFNEAAATVAHSLGRQDLTGVLPPETGAIVRRCLLGKTKLSLETSIGGRTFFWSFFPIEPTQMVHCYVSDITERLDLEGRLRHSQKLESVGRLAAGVAHDFNNILTVIQGHTGLLRSDPQLAPELSDSVQQVSRAAERAGKLTKQLLAFSRKSVLEPRTIDLNDVLTNIGTLLLRTLGEDIHFQFGYQPDLPSIYADPDLLEQVVMNVSVNARDAMPAGGQLMINTALVAIDHSYVGRHPDSRPGKFVCLSLTDTGCGMDHATMGRLFEPFFTTKEFGKGTGLGLATVYGIIKQHQGWIEVQSQLGQGSTFKIYLPPAAESGHAADPRKSHDEEAYSGTETILVVEDEAPVRQTARNILERYGYHVLEAANGVEALAVWHRSQNDIALLLTDVVMPVGLSGQELAEKFTSLKSGLKVIYTSGYSVESAGKGLPLIEGLHFLQKPFDAPQLARAVRGCLDS